MSRPPARPAVRSLVRAVPAGVAAVVLLAGCSSEEPPPIGADGSGSFRVADRVFATLTDSDGEAIGRAEAQADVADALELTVQVDGLEPGRYRVRLEPGATCDDASSGGGGGSPAPRLPALVVGEDGGAAYSAAVELGIDDLDGRAALRLRGDGASACGVLSDY